MKLVDHLNNKLRSIVCSSNAETIFYGQNINAGSCLGGLTKNLNNIDNLRILNTQNSENLLTGIGFGISLNNINSYYFMKQLDFLLLGIDHLVNTLNIFRLMKLNTTNGIFCILSDKGYEGPQSSFNSVSSISSIGNLDFFQLATAADVDILLEKHFFSNKFKVFCVSQTLLSSNLITLEPSNFQDDIFKYGLGRDLNIILFGNSMIYFEEIIKEIDINKCAIYSVNNQNQNNFEFIIDDIPIGGNILIVDDDRSLNKTSDRFLRKVLHLNKFSLKIIQREFLLSDLSPGPDRLMLKDIGL